MVTLIDVMAVYRLARLIAVDELTEPVRQRVEERSELAGYGIRCVWCVSVWVAVVVCLVPRPLWAVARLPLSLAGFAGFLGVVVARLEDF